jgi:hypothetical protein
MRDSASILAFKAGCLFEGPSLRRRSRSGGHGLCNPDLQVHIAGMTSPDIATGRRRTGRTLAILLLAIIVALMAVIAGGAWWMRREVRRLVDPAPDTIVSASLAGLREQNRMSAFVASYVAVVTSTQSRFGLSASKTLIMPGLVSYEVDLARLGDRDVRFDKATHTLFVTLPPIRLDGPQIDLTRIREYDSGGLLMRITDAAHTLDAANRAAGQADLLRQAAGPVPMSFAKDATRRAIAHSFALPLRAAGLDATVRVKFAGEAGFPAIDDQPMDRSRSLAEVYADKSIGNGL